MTSTRVPLSIANVDLPTYDELADLGSLIDSMVSAEHAALVRVRRPQRQPVVDICRVALWDDDRSADRVYLGICGATAVDGTCLSHDPDLAR